MEGMVLDEPRGVEAPGVDDESRSAQVAQIAVRVLARVILDGDIGEQGIGGSLIRWYHVFAQHAIGCQVVDDQRRRRLLLGGAQDVRKSRVQDPEPIATIGTYTKRRNDLRDAGGGVLMGLPRRIRDEGWRFARVWKPTDTDDINSQKAKGEDKSFPCWLTRSTLKVSLVL